MKRNIFILLLFLAVANLAFYFLATEKVRSDTREKEIECLTTLNAIEEIEDIGGGIKALQEKFDEARQGLVNFNSLLVDERELVDLVAEIARIANVSGVELQRVEYEPQLDAKEGKFRHIFVNLPVRGAYTKVRDFIHELEKIKKLIRIKDLTSIQVKPGEGNKLDLRLRLVVYFKADLDEAGAERADSSDGTSGVVSARMKISADEVTRLQKVKIGLASLEIETFKSLAFTSVAGDKGEGSEVTNIFEPLFIENIARQKVAIKKVEKAPEPPPEPVKAAVIPASPVQVVEEAPNLDKEKAGQWLDGFGFMGLIDRKSQGVEYFISDGKDFYVVKSGDSLGDDEADVMVRDGYLVLKHTAYDIETKLRIPKTGISE